MSSRPPAQPSTDQKRRRDVSEDALGCAAHIEDRLDADDRRDGTSGMPKATNIDGMAMKPIPVNARRNWAKKNAAKK